jgi:hypothetical protein
MGVETRHGDEFVSKKKNRERCEDLMKQRGKKKKIDGSAAALWMMEERIEYRRGSRLKLLFKIYFQHRF